MVVDSGADVVVTTTAGLDVVVAVVAVVDVVLGAAEAVEATVELVSATDDVVPTSSSAAVACRFGLVVVSTTVDVEFSVVGTTSLVAVSSARVSLLSSVNPEDSAPCGCRGWHAEKATTQASEAIATFRNSVFGMPNVRT